MSIWEIGKDLISTMFTPPQTHDYPKCGLNLCDSARGAVGIDNKTCTLCRLCERRCPAGAITVDRNRGRWLINRMSCVVCTECVDECPQKSLHIIKEYVDAEDITVVDIYDVEAVSGSDDILKDIEMPKAETKPSKRKRLIKCRCRKINFDNA